MSGTHQELRWGVTTDDPERWTVAQAEAYGWDQEAVVEKLSEVMEAAGNEFIAANPELFRSTTLV